MGSRRVSLGIDFGTESARALVVDLADGTELGLAVFPYPHGVIDEHLPGTDVRLGVDWALQHPGDWLEALTHCVPQALAQAGAKPEEVVGIGVDFTSCTVLPTDARDQPLCLRGEFSADPNAWPKLWKHHASQPQADLINQVARRRKEAFLGRYGGKVSSEWLFAKLLQVLQESPAVYQATHRYIEGGDWIVRQLTGVEARNACAAGYKALWDKATGYPSRDFLGELDPRFADVVAEKLSTHIVAPGTQVGTLRAEWAGRMGLRPGTPVAAATIDAHAAVPAATVTAPGKMVIIMGTSFCHLLLGEEGHFVEGICGVVEEGILPGYFGYEAGQVAGGDIYAWYVEHAAPTYVAEEAKARGLSVHQLLSERAQSLGPGGSGLLALDWWNGNRCILVDADLTGLLVGFTLSTRPEEIYRALIEATAFGTRKIIEAFVVAGVAVDELYASGGLPERNPLVMQIFSDVTGRPIRIAASAQTTALGAAILGALAAGKAAGGYDDAGDAARHMAKLKRESYRPNPQAAPVYDRLYREYERLHDYFGRGANDVMHLLKHLKQATGRPVVSS
jgi:L-ribulokinase